MSRIEHRINRTPELAGELIKCQKQKGWSQRRLAKEAGVSPFLVYELLHPEYPFNVSKELGAKVIEALADDPWQEFKLLGLARISVYRFRGSNRFYKLL